MLSACAVHQPYPLAAWGPLPPPPSEDCARFAGSYRNEGQMPGYEARPSLGVELFGKPELARATRIGFSLPTSNTLTVTVWEGTKRVSSRTLTSPGDFDCKAGRLVVRGRRFFAESAVAGWQSDTITLRSTDDYLVAQVEEFGVGLIFLVIPVGGKSTSWYRFPREHE